MNKDEVSECKICNKPLGADSKAMDYWTCHDHRNCIRCDRLLTAEEVQHALSSEKQELCCVRCLLILSNQQARKIKLTEVSDDTIITVTQQWVDESNFARLVIIPNPDLNVERNVSNALNGAKSLLSSMSYDDHYKVLKMLERVTEEVWELVNVHPEGSKERAIALRDEVKKREAKNQALTSSRPVASKVDEYEISLGHFMEEWKLGREVAKKTIANIRKFVESMVTTTTLIGAQVTKEQLQEFEKEAIEAMIKTGQLKRPQESQEPKGPETIQ